MKPMPPEKAAVQIEECLEEVQKLRIFLMEKQCLAPEIDEQLISICGMLGLAFMGAAPNTAYLRMMQLGQETFDKLNDIAIGHMAEETVYDAEEFLKEEGLDTDGE